MPNKKRADGVAQVAECLPSKCEALSLNSNTAKKQSRQRRNKAKSVQIGASSDLHFGP
jgi:hypothetical protein